MRVPFVLIPPKIYKPQNHGHLPIRYDDGHEIPSYIKPSTPSDSSLRNHLDVYGKREREKAELLELPLVCAIHRTIRILLCGGYSRRRS